MLGSARPEKDVKSTGEFDWWNFFSDGHLSCMCSSMWPVNRRGVFDTHIEDAVLQIGPTEKWDWLGSRNTATILFYHRGIACIRYQLADNVGERSNNHIFGAVLRCLVAYATLIKDDSRVAMSAEDLPLPIPNREVKTERADGTAMKCGRVGSRPIFFEKSQQEELTFMVNYTKVS